MRPCLLSCAALYVAQLVRAVPSPQLLYAFGSNTQVLDKLLIGSECSAPDARSPGKNGASRPDLKGQCQKMNNCPDDRLHIGAPTACASDIEDGVCCLTEIVACAGGIAGTCRNADIVHFQDQKFVDNCPHGLFLPLSPNICPSGTDQKVKIQCCLPGVEASAGGNTLDSAGVPNQAPIENTALPQSANLLGTYQPQEIASNQIGGTGFYQQQSAEQQPNVPVSYGNNLLPFASFLGTDNSQPPQLQATGSDEIYPSS